MGFSDSYNPTIRWAHLSDLHMPTDHANDFNISERLPLLMKDLKEFDPHFIVFSGDLAQSGKKQQYDKIEKLIIKPLAQIRQGLQGKLFFCPGNHDLDWDILNNLPKNIIVANSQDGMTNFLEESPALKLILSSQNAFRQMLTDNFNLKLDINKPISNTFNFTLKNKKVSLTLLDTTLLCKPGESDRRLSDRGADYGHLAIGHYQIAKAIKNISSKLQRVINKKADIRIVVTHHPLNYLASWDYDVIDELFKNHFDIHLYGHNHKPAFKHTVTNQGNLISIQTGSLFTEYHSNSLYTQFYWELNSQKIKAISRYLTNTSTDWKPQGEALEFPEPKLEREQTLSKQIPTIIGKYEIIINKEGNAQLKKAGTTYKKLLEMMEKIYQSHINYFLKDYEKLTIPLESDIFILTSKQGDSITIHRVAACSHVGHEKLLSWKEIIFDYRSATYFAFRQNIPQNTPKIKELRTALKHHDKLRKKIKSYFTIHEKIDSDYASSDCKNKLKKLWYHLQSSVLECNNASDYLKNQTIFIPSEACSQAVKHLEASLMYIHKILSIFTPGDSTDIFS